VSSLSQSNVRINATFVENKCNFLTFLLQQKLALLISKNNGIWEAAFWCDFTVGLFQAENARWNHSNRSLHMTVHNSGVPETRNYFFITKSQVRSVQWFEAPCSNGLVWSKDKLCYNNSFSGVSKTVKTNQIKSCRSVIRQVNDGVYPPFLCCKIKTVALDFFSCLLFPSQVACKRLNWVFARSLVDSRSSRDTDEHSRKCGTVAASGRPQMGQETSAVGSI